MSPEILRQVCLQTPGMLAQSWENIQDPSNPCWQVPVALKEEGLGWYSCLAAQWEDATHCCSGLRYGCSILELVKGCVRARP